MKEKDFIKNVEILPFKSKPLYTSLINLIISLKSKFIQNLPFIFGEKLTKIDFSEEKTLSAKDKRLVSECQLISDGQSLVMININRDNKANTDNQEFAKSAMLNIFPLIDTKIYMAGDAESDYWDKVVLAMYPSKERFCEMMLSHEYRKIQPLKINGLDDAYTSLTNQIPVDEIN